MNRIWQLGIVLVVACSQEAPPAETVVEADSVDVEAEQAVLPAMPAFPPAREGYLTTATAGQHSVSGAWEARAGVCEDPATLEVLAEALGTGTLILLRLPQDDRAGRYPVVVVQNGAPQPPAAQVGVQLDRDAGSFAFQATEGEVQVYDYDAHVSGRLAVTLREIQSDVRVQYAGVFDHIPLTPLAEDYCRRLKETVGQGASSTGVR